MTLNRRTLLKTFMGSAVGLPLTIQAANESPIIEKEEKVPHLPKNGKILFQGDSTTDGNRGRNNDPNNILGHGCVFTIAALCGGQYPKQNFRFINPGISGNKVNDLAARWQKDMLDLKPDLFEEVD